MMVGLPRATQRNFMVWIAIGLVIYFTYSRHHSRIGKAPSSASRSDGRRGCAASLRCCRICLSPRERSSPPRCLGCWGIAVRMGTGC